MYLPIRTINAIVTAYGSDDLVHLLKEKRLIEREATRQRAQDSLSSTALVRFLQKNSFDERDPTKRGLPDASQQEIFKLIAQKASKDDKALNALIASALRDLTKEPDHKVVTELALNGDKRNLLVDIALVTPTDIYCLELKWRSGLLSDGEVIRQTAGRVREYALELPELANLLELKR